MLLLLSSWIFVVITAEDAPVMHRVINGSICLQVRQTPPLQLLTWRFNGAVVVSPSTIIPEYKDKVDYNPKNHSMCIKRLAETDSGVYTFSFLNATYKELIETHRVIVQAPVPTPVIRMSALPSNLSGAHCKITVNCTVQDDWASYDCDIRSCVASRTSLGNVNISVFTNGSSVFCRGSNHVSMNCVSQSTASTCLGKTNPEHDVYVPPEKPVKGMGTLILIIVSVCICAGVIGLLSYCNRPKATPTMRLIQSQPVADETAVQMDSTSSTSSSSQAEVSYENVDPEQPRQTSSPLEEPRSEPSQTTETLYSILRAPGVTSSSGENGCGKETEIQEASGSWRINPHEAERRDNIDTLYSVLDKPKIRVTAPPMGQPRSSEARHHDE